MQNVTCPYCNNPAVYVDSVVIYRRSYGMIYWCRPCDAYVGVLKGTDIPFGTLANAEFIAHARTDIPAMHEHVEAWEYLAEYGGDDLREPEPGNINGPYVIKARQTLEALKGLVENG